MASDPNFFRPLILETEQNRTEPNAQIQVPKPHERIKIENGQLRIHKWVAKGYMGLDQKRIFRNPREAEYVML